MFWSINSVAAIHSTAIIGQDVSIGENVSIGPYAMVEDGVKIGANVEISSHAMLKKGTIIGDGCFVDSFAAIGGLPQDVSFDRKKESGVRIGNRTIVRECTTVHRATVEGAVTTIGENCLIQSGSHVAHDCILGNDIVMANGSMLGGFVELENGVFIGGGAAVHQFVRIGEHSFLGGNMSMALDLPPYSIGCDVSVIAGVNILKLHRLELPKESVIAFRNCFRKFYARIGQFRDRALQMLDEGYGKTNETLKFLNFFLRESRRGFAPKRKRVKCEAE
jgi:UDP-N-acetylglucosamine acyltransferase